MDKFPVDFATGERLRIREASREQYPEIRRLLRAAYAGYASAVTAAVFPVYFADVLDLTDDAAIVLAALDGDTIVGTARLRLRPAAADLPAGAAYVRGVAVQPGREGRGIARALMTCCAEQARTAGATSVYLHTTPFMTRAIRLYRGLGYRRAPEHDTNSSEHYGLTAAPPLRALAYRLDLTPQRSPCGGPAMSCAARPEGKEREGW